MSAKHAIDFMAGLALVAALGCDAGDKKSKPVITVNRSEVVVAYECSHSNAPFGPGGSVRNVTFDLGAKTQEVLAYEYEDPTLERPGTPKPKHEPVVTSLTDERVREIVGAVTKALQHAPYKPEYPVPEGTPCTLTIRDATGERLELEKAYTKEPDAASELVKVLVGPVQ